MSRGSGCVDFINIPELSHLGMSYMRWRSYLIPALEEFQILLSLLKEAGS